MFRTFAATTLAATAAATAMNSEEFEFMSFIAKMNKSYATREEYTVRLARFMYADAHIKKVNAPYSGFTHTAAHNKFSDWTEEEFERLMTLDKKNAEEKSKNAV